jgi:hypothetical protein
MRMCDGKELLVGFLYDEIDPVSKRTFERHLVMRGLPRGTGGAGATREQIALWSPPDADLGFRIVREGRAQTSRFRFFCSRRPGPGGSHIIVLATAAVPISMRYGSDGLAVHTGWNHSAESQAGVTPVG